jgi:uncharacterized membrane protein
MSRSATQRGGIVLQPDEEAGIEGPGPDGVTQDFLWAMDPMAFALEQAESRRRHGIPDPADMFCAEVGRRLLLAQFEFSRWVLRRVEKVAFASDRRVSRKSTIEFRVHHEAPTLVVGGRARYWLIPLSVMRRRTLVNLDIRDEGGGVITLMGLRFTQKLDEAMLRAAALLVRTGAEPGTLPPALETYIAEAVSGDRGTVKRAKAEFDSWSPGDGSRFNDYFGDPLFAATLERMWHNFTLYVTLPVDRGRHRLLRIAFEERVVWKYQLPDITTEQGVVAYRPMSETVPFHKTRKELLGFEATRIRFLTPSAENCTSYHFEFSAPTGLNIVRAALLAGRPNAVIEGHQPNASWDREPNPGQSVGLHSVEIPNGSLCRTQVDLRVPSRGWLSTLLVACWVTMLVMASVLWHVRLVDEPEQWSVDQVTNIVLLLVTVCAGSATYVAQQHSGDVAARMVTGLRMVGAVAISIPAVTATCLVYLGDPVQERWEPLLTGFMLILFMLSLAACYVVTRAWRNTRRDEGREAGPRQSRG